MRLRSGFLLFATVMATLLAFPLSAHAAPAGAAPGGSHPFDAQARRAGLTAAQATTLQGQVAAYLAKVGGTQTAANEIRLPNGGDLLVVLPGETTARHLDAPLAPPGCPGPGGGSKGYLCAYSGTNYTGSIVSAYFCGLANRVDIPFASEGSWINNQNPQTVGSFWDDSGEIENTGGAFSAGTPIDWNRILYMVACNP